MDLQPTIDSSTTNNLAGDTSRITGEIPHSRLIANAVAIDTIGVDISNC